MCTCCSQRAIELGKVKQNKRSLSPFLSPCRPSPPPTGEQYYQPPPPPPAVYYTSAAHHGHGGPSVDALGGMMAGMGMMGGGCVNLC